MRLIAALLLAASPAVAKPFLDAGPSDRVALNLPADVALISASAVGFLVPELLKGKLAPAHCFLCDGNDDRGLPGTGSSGSLNAVDAFFHDSLTGTIVSRKTADTVSSVWAFALLPLGSVAAAAFATGPHASDGAGARAAVIVVESALVSSALVQGVKFFAARKRPFVRYGHGTDGADPATGTTYDVNDRDSHIGLPSGHTALATALGVSAAMTATLEDSKAAPWLWGAAAAMSISTGALRIMAEKHYFTDTVAGAALGAACGVVLPLLHKRGNALSQSVSVAPGVVTLSFAM